MSVPTFFISPVWIFFARALVFMIMLRMGK